MSLNAHFLEKNQVVGGIVPVNLATGANSGDWVSLKEYGRCAIVLFAGVGTVANDPVITLNQAKDVSGTGSKALTFTRADVKAATAITSVGQFTTTTQAAANTFTLTGDAALQKIAVIDIKAEDLDIDNNFDCLQATIADVGTNTQLGCVLYFLHNPRDETVPLPSAIID